MYVTCSPMPGGMVIVCVILTLAPLGLSCVVVPLAFPDDFFGSGGY